KISTLYIFSYLLIEMRLCLFFFFQAEDGIRDKLVTGVQTCALPISFRRHASVKSAPGSRAVRKSLPCKFALRKMAPLKFRPDKSACERSAPARSARAPPSFPRKNISCACKISVNFLPLCLMLFGFLSPMLDRKSVV